jgi:hypothetical protein
MYAESQKELQQRTRLNPENSNAPSLPQTLRYKDSEGTATPVLHLDTGWRRLVTFAFQPHFRRGKELSVLARHDFVLVMLTEEIILDAYNI